MSEKDAFFSFFDGLKAWAKMELQWSGVQELAKAMVIAKGLIEFKSKNNSTRPKEMGREREER